MHPFPMVTGLRRDRERETRGKHSSCFCTPQSTYSTEHMSLIENAPLYSIWFDSFYSAHTHRIREVITEEPKVRTSNDTRRENEMQQTSDTSTSQWLYSFWARTTATQHYTRFSVGTVHNNNNVVVFPIYYLLFCSENWSERQNYARARVCGHAEFSKRGTVILRGGRENHQQVKVIYERENTFERGQLDGGGGGGGCGCSH